jgi:hypothetical protein
VKGFKETWWSKLGTFTWGKKMLICVLIEKLLAVGSWSSIFWGLRIQTLSSHRCTCVYIVQSLTD